MSLSPNAQAKKMRVYRAPSSPIAYFFWRIKMWFEATFALSMLERWEKVLLCAYSSMVSLPFHILFPRLSYSPLHSNSDSILHIHCSILHILHDAPTDT
jgi:hypothetical protein